jgi:hypothetical protein
MTPAEKERMSILECERENYRVQLTLLLPQLDTLSETVSSLKSSITEPVRIEAISDDQLILEVKRRMQMRFDTECDHFD